MNVKAALSYRLMGVPAWVWGLVVGGAVVAYAYITRGSSDTPKTSPDAGPSYVDSGGAADAGDIQGVPTVTENTVPVTTNPAWIRVVTDRLVATGYDPIQVNNALTKGLAGIMMTAQEAALWNEAVRRFGAPPEGAPPILTVPLPGPATDNGDTSTGAKYATVLPGWHVSQWITDYRAHPDGVPDFTWEKLEALNPGVSANIKWNKDPGQTTFIRGAVYRTR